MAGQGSGGNVLAAICSFFIPGLGQLVQGRLLPAFIHFVLAAILFWVWLWWIVSIYSAYDAAVFDTARDV
jgi:TM2 domain-containing membrane protein YozV